MNDNVVRRLVSSDVSKEIGHYMHITKITPNTTFYTFSGQVGADLHGHFPEEYKSISKQYIFKHIKSIKEYRFNAR